ncbi:MAG TPA: putative Ig domain-containing protein [Blastocatellia bacterium]|nr:putative Ig domain-containing protein [Blastocatellia bacterium]
MKRFTPKPWARPFLITLFVLSLAPSALSTTVIVPSDDDMIIGARAIITGRVISTGASLDPRQDRIYTYVTIKVQEVIKGEISERFVVLKELGGQVGERFFTVYGNPRFKTGEKVLLYLDTWSDGSLRVHQMFLGKFDITKDALTGRETVSRGTPDHNTLVVQSGSHDARTDEPSTESMEFAAYTRMLRERLAVNRERAAQFEQQYYSGVAIKSRPEEFRSIKKSRLLQPQFSFLTSPPSRWFEPDDDQPVRAVVNVNGAPSATAVADAIAAMNAWSNVPGSSMRIQSAGTTSECYLGSDLNGIGLVFDNCDGRNSPSPRCSGTLAWGGFSGVESDSKVINGTLFRKVTQGFVSFNPWACRFQDSCNLQEVATHELGHAIGLGHSTFNEATMAPSAHFDLRCASLKTDDINGVTFIYPASSGGAGPLTIVTPPALQGTSIGSAYSQPLAASGGTPPYLWSIVAGAGSLPPGLALNPVGSITGIPTAADTYNFRLKVTDAALVSVERDFAITVSENDNQFNSTFASQTVPAQVNPGQRFTVNVKWNNTGTQAWNGSAGFRAVSQNPANNATWGGNTVAPIGVVVLPGQQLDLNFIATAPTTPGTYNFQWMLAQNNVFFGEASVNVAIQVGDAAEPPPAVNDAAFVSHTMPGALNTGQAAAIFVTMRNTGNTTWEVGTYKLGSQNPSGNTTWGVNAVDLSGPVAPGAEVTFLINAVAPASPGTYSFQWQMMKQGEGYFGALPDNLAVTVNQPVSVLEIMTPSLDPVEAGQPYAQQLIASGGTEPYTWTLRQGVLPNGLSLDALGGISGTPTSVGTFQFTVQVRDSADRTADRQLAVTVTSPPLPISIITNALPTGLTATGYTATLEAVGGSPPFTWSVVAGTIPSGLGLNSATGVISGTPATSGVFPLTLRVQDRRGAFAQVSLQITIGDPVPPPVINKVKYKKGKKKLVVTGTRVDVGATLLINGRFAASGFKDGSITVKRVIISSGAHEIRIVNVGGISSAAVILIVD